MKVKVFNLEQPYAWLVGRYKFWETRGSNISYRGKIAIYAIKKINADVYAELADLLPPKEELATGAIVAIADLVDCKLITEELRNQRFADELRCGIWEKEEGKKSRYACKLENITILDEPIPVKGVMPGQWNLDLADEIFNNSENLLVSRIYEFLDRCDRPAQSVGEIASAIGAYFTEVGDVLNKHKDKFATSESHFGYWVLNRKEIESCSQQDTFSAVVAETPKAQLTPDTTPFGQLTMIATPVPSTEPDSPKPCLSKETLLPSLTTTSLNFQRQKSLLVEALAQISAWQVTEPDFKEAVANCFLNTSDFCDSSSRRLLSLKTSGDCFQVDEEQTSKKSFTSLPSWGIAVLGNFATETDTSLKTESEYLSWVFCADVRCTQSIADKPSLQSIIGEGNSVVFRASGGDRTYTEESPTLRSLASTGNHQSGSGAFKVQESDILRPLTATEAEQIMGWPVDSTKIGINEEGEKICMSQTQRIKTLGNGIIPGEITELLANLKPILERRLEKEVPQSKKVAYKQLRKLGKTHRESLSIVVQ